MRSRYTAFATENADYLLKTHHPKTRSSSLEKGLLRTFREVKWIGLQILNTSGGKPHDKKGTVTFEATFLENGKTDVLTERSRFEKYRGNWVYVDGKQS